MCAINTLVLSWLQLMVNIKPALSCHDYSITLSYSSNNTESRRAANNLHEHSFKRNHLKNKTSNEWSWIWEKREKALYLVNVVCIPLLVSHNKSSNLYWHCEERNMQVSILWVRIHLLQKTFMLFSYYTCRNSLKLIHSTILLSITQKQTNLNYIATAEELITKNTS